MPASTVSNATLTQDVVARILLVPLQQKSTFLSLGSPIFSSAGEPIHVPKLTSYGSPSYTTQGSAIAEVNPTTDEVVLLPSTIKSLKAISRLSNELIRQSVIEVESQFSMKIVADMAKAMDAAFWDGAGSGGAPLGLFGMSGYTNAGTVAAGSVTSGNLFDMEESYSLTFSAESSARWAFHPSNFTRIRKMTDNYGARILQPSLAAGAPNTILGHPYVVTAHAPTDEIALFDKDQVAVGIDQQASVTILDQTYGEYDEVGIRVTARSDIQPLNAASIVKLKLS